MSIKQIRTCDICGQDMSEETEENVHFELSISRGGFWGRIPHIYEELELDFCSSGCQAFYISRRLLVDARDTVDKIKGAAIKQ